MPPADPESLLQILGSITLCTPETVAKLKILLGRTERTGPKTGSNGKPSTDGGRPTPASRARAATTRPPTEKKTSTTTKARHNATTSQDTTLSSGEQIKFASKAFNVSLKTLTDAPGEKASHQKPLKDVSPNKPKSKIVAGARAPKNAIEDDCKGAKSVAECACASINFLVLARPSKTNDLKLENGIIALVGKLLGKGLLDLAFEELSILHRCLEGKALSDLQIAARLLDFSTVDLSNPASIMLLTNYEMLVLRLILQDVGKVKLDALSTCLDPDCEWSPENILKQLSLDSANSKSSADFGRGMSQVMLHLAPVLVKVDTSLAIQTQIVALRIRLSTCYPPHEAERGVELERKSLETFLARTCQQRTSVTTKIVSQAVTAIQLFRDAAKNMAADCDKESHYETLYRLIADMHSRCGELQEAQAWMRKARDCAATSDLSQLRLCSITVGETTLALKSALNDPSTIELNCSFEQPLSVLSGQLSGSMSELSAALKDVITLRKAVYDVLRSPVELAWLTQSRRAELYEFLGLCAKFLTRFLGPNPTRDADEDTSAQYQARLDVVSPLARAHVETTLFAAKKAEGSEQSEMQALGKMLNASASILSRLCADRDASYNTPQLDSETREKLAIGLSNAYWSLSTKAKGELVSAEVVELMQSSCRVMTDQGSAAQRAGNVPLKLYQLARYLTTQQKPNQRETFQEAIRACLRVGVPDERQTNRATADSSSNSEDAQLQQIFHASLRNVISSATEVSAGGLYDDESLDMQSRRRLAESQLEMMSTDRALRKAMRTDYAKVGNQILGLTNGEQHLTLRMQLLSRVLQAAEFNDTSIWTEIEVSARELLKIDPGDSGSSNALPTPRLHHLQATLAASLGPHSPSGPRVYFEFALERWKSLPTAEDLSLVIDSVDDCISAVLTMAAYFDMQGLDNQRLTALCFLEKAQRALRPDLPNMAYRRRLDIAQLLQRMGFSEKAEQHLSTIRQEFSNAESDLTDRALFMSVDVCSSVTLQRPIDHVKMKENLEGLLLECEEHVPDGERKSRVWLSAADVCQALHALATSNGETAGALLYARRELVFLQRVWKHSPEERHDHRENKSEASGNSQHRNHGPELWPVVPRMVAALLQAASACRDFGYAQDAQALIEQASRVSSGAGSEFLQAQVRTEQGDFECRRGDSTSGERHFTQAMTVIGSMVASRQLAIFNETIAYSNQLTKQWPAVWLAYDRARDVLRDLTEPEFVGSLGVPGSPANLLSEGLGKLSLKETKLYGQSKKTRTVAKKPTGHVKGPSTDNRKDVEVVGVWQMEQLQADLARRRADTFIAQNELEEASKILNQLSVPFTDIELKALAEATSCSLLLRQALASMEQNTIFSMLSDSVLSLPALKGPDTMSNASAKVDPKSKTKTQSGAKHARTQSVNADFSKPLRDGLTRLLKFQDAIPQGVSSFTASRIAGLVTTAAILDHSSTPCGAGQGFHPAQAAWYIELPRNIAADRERKALVIDNVIKSKAVDSDHNSEDGVDKTSLLYQNFQTDFVDFIPASWVVISLTLSEDTSHLYIVQYKARATPFVLRLPLQRSHSEDTEDEGLSFEEAEDEMRSIITESDVTIERAKGGSVDMSSKPEKTKWWAEREALDGRIQNLMVNIESLWLGGFRSIFNPSNGNETAAHQFENAFNSILDSHLPSRSQRKATNSTPLKLDSKIFELFTGLQDPSDDEVDLEEALTDLLYFVVDILQFHGEHNAYDEIDFDAMIIETQDALKAYHADLTPGPDATNHLILVLDKRLHAFPWEALPALEGRAVSRLPSLLDLRVRIERLRRNAPAQPPGVHLPATNGTYMLNPSRDLPKTQSRFEAPLASAPALATWTAMIAQAPSESDFTAALTRSPVLLYIGHGSGCQYVRGKAIRRLGGQCGAALLFGCSSAALRGAGEFEPVGVPKHYMVAGAPAVLGALWDVTDGDCDAFAAGVLRRWGLLGREVRIEGGRRKKKKTTVAASSSSGQRAGRDAGKEAKVGLDEAVASSRDDCYLKYLNGAAMVVYGVPCYLCSD